MKFYFFIPIISIFLFQKQNPHLEGKYKLVYDNRYYLPSSIITFKDSSYIKRTSDNYYLNDGNIKYHRYLATMVDKHSNLQIEFSKENIEKDTIHFSTKDLNGKSPSYMEISVNTGKLIKIKN
jgi:hypothetical protein